MGDDDENFGLLIIWLVIFWGLGIFAVYDSWKEGTLVYSLRYSVEGSIAELCVNYYVGMLMVAFALWALISIISGYEGTSDFSGSGGGDSGIFGFVGSLFLLPIKLVIFVFLLPFWVLWVVILYWSGYAERV